MQSNRERPDVAAADASPHTSRPSKRAAVLLQVLEAGGYGIWLWLGLSLLLGLGRPGRSSTLVPLALGAALVVLGLLLACLRLPGLASWHGWRPRPGHRPARSALMAMATWLPVLAVAGLAHGDNDFWGTRLAGAALMLCSLVSLLLTTHDDRVGLPEPLQRTTALLPACRITTAAYVGGLCLWLSMLAQGASGNAHGIYLRILLLALALGLGLLESELWQSLREQEPLGKLVASRYPFSGRVIAALLTYALPCTVLLLGDAVGQLPAAALAASGCVLGRALARHQYETALAVGASPKQA